MRLLVWSLKFFKHNQQTRNIYLLAWNRRYRTVPRSYAQLPQGIFAFYHFVLYSSTFAIWAYFLSWCTCGCEEGTFETFVLCTFYVQEKRARNLEWFKCLLSATFFSQPRFSFNAECVPMAHKATAWPSCSFCVPCQEVVFLDMESSNNEQIHTATPQEKSEAATFILLQAAVENSEFSFQAACQLDWVSFSQVALLNKCSLLCLEGWVTGTLNT